jgi:hypothetical protein
VGTPPRPHGDGRFPHHGAHGHVRRLQAHPGRGTPTKAFPFCNCFAIIFYNLPSSQPKKIAAKAIEYESELRNHNYGVKKRYYGHSKTASSETH